MKRVIIIILDSLGIGNAPDAEAFGDLGANTLKSVMSENPDIRNLRKLGLGNINEVDYIEDISDPLALYGSLEEISAGKDTTIGHWEIAGLEIHTPLPTYPNGFPKEIMDEFEEKIGRGTLCNLPYSGTEVIKEYGPEHIKTGKPIVYTSNDSVFQIAAHEDVIPLKELYAMCEIARKILRGDHALARVIARPFIGENGNYTRTSNRRDFSLSPFEPTLLDHLKQQGFDVISVGKIYDIFNGSGLTQEQHTDSNMDGVNWILKKMDTNFSGLLFANLVDFDAQFGHRRDPKGYAKALEEFDQRLPEILSKLRKDDLLIMTADHGNDPCFKGTDHTRERVPVLFYKKGINPRNIGSRRGFHTIAATIYDYLGAQGSKRGESVLKHENV
ncbi:MAG TPA: phosphopentomutase [Clostridia bacterium]|nr:phosphopentomutase [Clostridia bacterium]